MGKEVTVIFLIISLTSVFRASNHASRAIWGAILAVKVYLIMRLHAKPLPAFLAESEAESQQKLTGELPSRCDICNATPALRSHHVTRLHVCLPKYDHFCTLLDVPVYELNQFSFMMLMVVLFCESIGLSMSLIGKTISGGLDSWQVVMLVVAIVMGPLSLFELIEQLISITTNTTTYEREYEHNLSYTLDFDYGLGENLRCAAMQKATRLWRYAGDYKPRVRWYFKLIDNEYYSCC